MKNKQTIKRIGIYLSCVLLFFLAMGLLIRKLDATIQESIKVSDENLRNVDGEETIAVTKDGMRIVRKNDGSYKLHYEDGGYVLLKDMMNYTIGYSNGTKVVKKDGQYLLSGPEGHGVLLSTDGSYVILEGEQEIAKGTKEGSVLLADGTTHSDTSEDYLASFLRENQLNPTKAYDAYIEEIRLFIQNQ